MCVMSFNRFMHVHKGDDNDGFFKKTNKKTKPEGTASRAHTSDECEDADYLYVLLVALVTMHNMVTHPSPWQ